MESTLRPVDVAQVLRVDVRTIYELIRSGRLPAMRLGRVYRVAPEALDQLEFEPRMNEAEESRGLGA